TEQRVHMRTEPGTVSLAEQVVDDQAMAVDNFPPSRFVAPIRLCRQARTFEKLIRHPLEGGNHYNDRLSARFLEDNFGDVTDATACCERGAAKFKDFHSVARW